ncbi:MAG: HAD family hydrolase [Oscillospiraceae bacterium]|nr:HAD family hydrolase [Oscillospiraceae bacterium]
MKFDNTILITDADGTVLTDDKRVLEVDKAAISELINNGGLFTLATGRGVAAARSVVKEFMLDSNENLLRLPLVVFNGAAVYDFIKDEFLWKCELSDNAVSYVEIVLEKFPDVAVEILIDDTIYVVSTNEFEEMHLDFAGIEPVRCSYGEVPKEGWIKVLVIDRPEIIDEVIEFTRRNPCEYVHMVRSYTMYYEILPKDVNKWTGIQKLLEILNIKEQNRRIITAGDYMNDLEMLEQSDIGFATANAEDIVKETADFTVCDCNSGVARDIVVYLKGV